MYIRHMKSQLHFHVNICEFIIKFNKVAVNKKNIYFLAVFSVINGAIRGAEKENLTQ